MKKNILIWNIAVYMLLFIGCSQDVEEHVEEQYSSKGVKISNFKDTRDGQVYHTATFGDAGEWMTENLAFEPPASYGGLTYIHSATTSTAPSWTRPSADGITEITETQAKAQSYGSGRLGYLYNWAAAMKIADSRVTSGIGSQGICPTGWHLPTDTEWTALEAEIAAHASKYSTSNDGLGTGYGPEGSASIAFRSTTKVPNSIYPLSKSTSNSADDGGFNGLLVGAQGDFGNSYGSHTSFWSSTSVNDTNAYYRGLNYFYADVFNSKYGHEKDYRQFSVRCVKNK
ncbi:MAG: hypothetical protein LBN93_09750 [Candidatus Symbiothrix sp.]|jgi:uncharacterized protein (TIGR02145 family)|nr:hypothetical protein [Candidatus Symbiothrix sp.]